MIYTIGDLHLSFKENKPMSVFGENWNGHEEKIKKDWLEKVRKEDLVVLPGDFSWATYLKDTDEDFWWNTLTKMREFLEENNFNDIDFLYNNSYEFEGKVIVGARGWSMTDELEDIRLFKREAIRLELSIQDGIKKYGQNKEFIAFTHYPPITRATLLNNELNDMLRILMKYNIKKCYYGHLHSSSIKEAVEGEHFGINFKLVSADGLDFKLEKIL